MLEDLCDAAVSIKFNHSEDGEGDDSQSSPDRHPNTSFTVKCFKCYGTKLRFCQECGSSQSIKNTHPMAMLLNQVLMRKLNLKKSNDSRLQHEEVYPIKEQEEEIQDKRPICAYCSKQCDANHYYCDQCPCFTVCSNCSVNSQLHEHKLFENISISECIRGNSTIEIKYCCNCNSRIQNCYTECKTCRISGIDCKICNECIDNRAYIHSITHIMEMVTDNDFLRDDIDTVSQEFQDDRELNFHDSKIEINYLDEPKELQKKNSSIAHCQESHDTLFGNVLTSINCNKINVQISRVHLQIEDLFSSTTEVGIKGSAKLAGKQEKQQMEVVKRSKSHHNTRVWNKENKNPKLGQIQDYVFIGYKCDICETQPIINVRYHCQQCPDFDVCQQCFETCKDAHLHQSFDRVNGRQLREKAVEKLFHDRDLNLRESCANQKQFTNYLDVHLRKNQRNKTDYFHLNLLEQNIE